MRTKKRQTNLQLLQQSMKQLSTGDDGCCKDAIKDYKESMDVIKPVEKIKKGRGPPKKALINTSALLTR